MAQKTIIEGLEGLKAAVGNPLGASDWQVLAFEDIVRFAEATGDFQWIHVDRERCLRESPFKVPIAHGYYSVSRIAGLFFEALELRGFALILNYGLNKVRFPTPLKAGARYRLTLQLQEVRDIPKGAEAVMLATIEVDGEPKPACVAELVYRALLP
ncbi:MaoC family dehydratase [Myxococcaceae bacterium GXIMD 01537]